MLSLGKSLSNLGEWKNKRGDFKLCPVFHRSESSSGSAWIPGPSSQTPATTRSKDVNDDDAQVDASTASGRDLLSTFLGHGRRSVHERWNPGTKIHILAGSLRFILLHCLSLLVTVNDTEDSESESSRLRGEQELPETTMNIGPILSPLFPTGFECFHQSNSTC